MNLDWQAVVLIACGLCLLGFLGFIFMSRDRQNRKLRFGFFFERERHDDEEK